MRQKIGVVIDPWDYPYNGTVVSTRRFVQALETDIEFRLFAIPGADGPSDKRVIPFRKLSIPGFNRIIDNMKVPLANPWGGRVEQALIGLDLVHMQFPFFLGAAVCRTAKKMGLPLICSFHVQPENLLRNLGIQSPLLSRWLYRLFVWAMYRHADLVLTPSEFAANELRKAGLKKPIEVLSNGVPERFFQQPRTVGEKTYYELLSVGRFAPEKHQELILNAVARSKHADRICLRLIGTGPLEEHLKDLSMGLGLNAKIDTADDRALLEAYSGADLFVHAGEVELEGMSVLEAMAAGNAVLVSDSKDSAAVEFVDDPFATFDSTSVDDLTQKIDYWLEHPEARDKAGKRNRDVAGTRHHSRSAQQLQEIYRRYRASVETETSD